MTTIARSNSAPIPQDPINKYVKASTSTFKTDRFNEIFTPNAKFKNVTDYTSDHSCNNLVEIAEIFQNHILNGYSKPSQPTIVIKHIAGNNYVLDLSFEVDEINGTVKRRVKIEEKSIISVELNDPTREYEYSKEEPSYRICEISRTVLKFPINPVIPKRNSL